MQFFFILIFSVSHEGLSNEKEFISIHYDLFVKNPTEYGTYVETKLLENENGMIIY